MFLKKLHNWKGSLLFRLTFLYAITFTILSSIGFTVFYYRIYSVTMERMDDELREELHRGKNLMDEKFNDFEAFFNTPALQYSNTPCVVFSQGVWK